METTGKKWIKIASVIMLIFGGLGTVLSIAGIIGYTQMDAVMIADMESIGLSIRDQKVQLSVDTVVFAIEAIVGIFGLLQLKREAAGKLCLIAGAVLVVCQIARMFVSVVMAEFSLMTLFSFGLSLIFPVLYCAGALKWMKGNNV